MKPAPHWLTQAEIDEIGHRWVTTRYYSHDAVTGWWYFWDETGADCCGPYTFRYEVEEAMRLYGESL